MRQRHERAGLRVQGQGRAYAAVVGVTVGMLVAGLGVPLAFGRTPGTAVLAQASAQLDPAFADGGAPAPLGTPRAPAGAAATPTRVDGPTPAPVTTTGSTGASAPVLPPVAVASSTTPPLERARQTAGASPSAARLTATDQGVTATSVKVGVVLLDIQALKPLGFSQARFTPAEQRQQYQAFLDQVNKSGGLSGRRITPDYVTYNPLDTNGSQSGGAICIRLAENDKVFAVMGVLDGNIAECLTQQYGIPALANVGHLTEAYSKGHNLLATPSASLQRGAANWGDLAARSGLLRGRKSGTVSTAIPQEAVPEQSLVNALAAGGAPVTYRARLSGDTSTAQSQIPVEVQKMTQAGVNTVFLATSFITALQWAQSAERQGFRPLYVVSDLGSLSTPGLVGNMPSSFNGAYAFTQGNPLSPENPLDEQCRETFNAATGQDYAAGSDVGGLRLFCWMVTVLKAAADQVGADLTRVRLASAFQHLGSPSVPHSLAGSFKPGKTDYSDSMRPERYASSCSCYQSAGGAQRGRY
ncbi:MAG: hypothetical protein JWL64_2205 [Frankiales bacterium]|nr:hypothetical protein [Frankiales bacterium]